MEDVLLELFSQMNFFGMGPSLIGLGLALVLAIAITSHKLKEKDFYDTVFITLVNVVLFYNIGLITSLPLVIVIVFLSAFYLVIYEENGGGY